MTGSHTTPRCMLFVAFEGMGMLDFTGPLTVFWSASAFMEKQGRRGYARHTVSLGGGLISTPDGARLDTLPIEQFENQEVDTIIVPGAFDIRTALEDGRLAKWLAVHGPKARRVASVCTGSFFLAEAGLLNGRRSATHWGACELLQQRYPEVLVEPDPIYVQDGQVWTSAGVTAGIDLALALVEEDCGREIAMRIARQLVVYLKRPGGQSQYSELLRSQEVTSTAFEKLHRWLCEHLGEERLNVEMLAAQTGMSLRNFARSYKAKTGRTPAKAIELFRLEAARRLLEDGEDPIGSVARKCGFGDEERMRITFQRHLATSPRDYRQRFSVRHGGSAVPLIVEREGPESGLDRMGEPGLGSRRRAS